MVIWEALILSGDSNMLIWAPDYPAMRGNLEPKVLKHTSSVSKHLETMFESNTGICTWAIEYQNHLHK